MDPVSFILGVLSLLITLFVAGDVIKVRKEIKRETSFRKWLALTSISFPFGDLATNFHAIKGSFGSNKKRLFLVRKNVKELEKSIQIHYIDLEPDFLTALKLFLPFLEILLANPQYDDEVQNNNPLLSSGKVCTKENIDELLEVLSKDISERIDKFKEFF